MKSITCKDMGGPCDFKISGNTAEEVMKSGADHINSVDDDGHKQVVAKMAEDMKNPEAGKKWDADFKAKFDALPEDSN